MATSFLSKAPIQLDNIIVYQGLPASKKKSPPTATRVAAKSTCRRAQPLEARWSFPAVENEPTARSDVAADVNPPPADHDSSHSNVVDSVRTSHSHNRQLLLESLESFKSFDINSIMSSSRLSSEGDPPDIGVTPNLDVGCMTDLRAVGTMATEVARHEVLDCVQFETMQTSTELQPPTDTPPIDAALRSSLMELPTTCTCQGLIEGGLAPDELGDTSDDSTPVAPKIVDCDAALSELAVLDLFEPPTALQEVLQPTVPEAGPGLKVSQEGHPDDTFACQAIDLSDPSFPAVEEDDRQQQQLEQPRSASDESVSPGRPADSGSDDDDTPFVPGRRRRKRFSARFPADELHDGIPTSARVNSTTTENLQPVRRGRKRLRVETGDADDDDSPCSPEAKSPYLGNSSSQESTAERREARRSGSSDPQRLSAHLAAIGLQVPYAMVHSPPQRRHRRRARGRATATRQPETRVASVRPEMQEQPTWAIDRIVKSAQRNGEVFYRVKWKDTWEPAASLRGCADTAVAEFYAQQWFVVFHRQQARSTCDRSNLCLRSLASPAKGHRIPQHPPFIGLGTLSRLSLARGALSDPQSSEQDDLSLVRDIGQSDHRSTVPSCPNTRPATLEHHHQQLSKPRMSRRSRQDH